nr:hypothetical protein Iba_chr10dCG12450 [Ipomoea batatas]
MRLSFTSRWWLRSTRNGAFVDFPVLAIMLLLAILIDGHQPKIVPERVILAMMIMDIGLLYLMINYVLEKKQTHSFFQQYNYVDDYDKGDFPNLLVQYILGLPIILHCFYA